MNRNWTSLICASFVLLCCACSGASAHAQSYGVCSTGACNSNPCTGRGVLNPCSGGSCAQRCGGRGWYQQQFGGMCCGFGGYGCYGCDAYGNCGTATGRLGYSNALTPKCYQGAGGCR